MKLYDFEKALETGQHTRAGWGGGTLVSKGIVDREVRVDADRWEMCLAIMADDGFRWVSAPWEIWADCHQINPMSEMPLGLQVLAGQLGLIAADFGAALRDAAPRLVASMRDESGELEPAKTEAEAARRYSEACNVFDRQVRAWLDPLEAQEIDVEAVKLRHQASVLAMVEGAMLGVRREG